MNIAIVDDENFFIHELSQTLCEWNNDKIDINIFPFLSGEEIIEGYRTDDYKFDLIFMDITLGGIDGLETAQVLRLLGYEREIAFTTNHRVFEYAQQSMNVYPIGYYAKPVIMSDVASCMSALLQNKAFTYFYNSKQFSIPYKQILYFESKKNYIKLHTIDQNSKLPMYRSNMESLFLSLPPTFLRCHRSYIVNMLHVTLVEEKKLYLRNIANKTLSIGDMYLNDILNYYTNI